MLITIKLFYLRIKKHLLLLCHIFKYIIMNDKRKKLIEYAMFSLKLNKQDLADAMGMSYPTMLSKLKNIGSFRLDEYDKLNDILNLNNK